MFLHKEKKSEPAETRIEVTLAMLLIEVFMHF